MPAYEIKVNGVVRASLPSAEGDQVAAVYTDENGNTTAFVQAGRPQRATPEVAIEITRSAGFGAEQPSTATTNIEDMTVAELHELAEQKGVAISSKARKADIIEAIETSAESQPANPETVKGDTSGDDNSDQGGES